MSELIALLGVAIVAGDVGQVRSLMQRGLDPNVNLGQGTPLHFSACVWAPHNTEEERIAVCAELLSKGANVNAVSALGATPLDDAYAAGKPKLAAFLKSRGGQSRVNHGGVSDAQLDQMTGDVLAGLGLGVGVGQRRRSAPQVAPAANTGSGCLPSFLLAVALTALMGFGLHKAGLLDQLLTRPAEVAQTPGQKASRGFLDQAETAIQAKQYLAAATRAEQAITSLKAENATGEEMWKAKELAARASYKAKRYQEACTHYAYLAKARPKEKSIKDTLKLVQTEYWRQQLQPKYSQAQSLLARGDYDEARVLATDVLTASRSAGLALGPTQELLSRIDSSHAQAAAAMSAAKKDAYFKEVITVYDAWGTPSRMTRREFLKRKGSGAATIRRY